MGRKQTEGVRYVTAADLDKVSPNNPVWLWHTTGHYGVANSKAMQLAEIKAETKDPPAGTIDRDTNGQPTGVLKEDPAMELVARLIPPYTREQQRAGILKMMADFNKEGMTAAKDPGITPERWEIYRELFRKIMSVRIFTLFFAGTTMDSANATLARFNSFQGLRNHLKKACYLQAALKFSWMAAAVRAQRGSMNHGIRSQWKSIKETPDILRSIPGLSTNGEAIS